MQSASQPDLSEKDIAKVLEYIENYWQKITRHHTKDEGTLIGLPNPFVIPSPAMFEEQYYWDSYPVVRALLMDSKRQKLAIGMVDNLLYEVERFGFVPNASRLYYLSRSQPPFLSSMVWDVFETTRDVKWFRRAIKLVEREYLNVWASEVHPHERKVYRGLSRYYDINISDEMAMAESGWDNTMRFEQGALNILPVDLNCLLYIYEQDLAKAFGLLSDYEREDKYKKAARSRARTVNEVMWSEKRGFYFDFNFKREKRLAVTTVAGMFPMVAGIADSERVKKMLKVFGAVLECDWGVVQSEKFEKGLQWDYPNGWPIIQIKVVEGLMRHGFVSDAKRIIKKWLAVNIKIFKETGYLWEKYDVVNGKVGVADRYPTQSGFGWTNACFLIMLDKLNRIEKQEDEEKMESEIFVQTGLSTSI